MNSLYPFLGFVPEHKIFFYPLSRFWDHIISSLNSAHEPVPA